MERRTHALSEESGRARLFGTVSWAAALSAVALVVSCGGGEEPAGGSAAHAGSAGRVEAAHSGAGTDAAGAPQPPPLPDPLPPPPEYPLPEGTADFAEDVAPIVHGNCVPCHRTGGAGPFPLVTYDDVLERERQLLKVIGDGYMPPWPPQQGCGEFRDVRALTPREIGIVRQWVREGMAEGDPAAAPEPPPAPRGWSLGEPDLVIEMQQTYTLYAEGLDVYRHFVLPIPIQEDRYVRAFEFEPDNASIVHHARLHLDPERRSRALDAEDPEPGFEEMVIGATVDPDGHWLGWTPGKRARFLPEGMAWTLRAGTDMVLELHLVPTGKPEPIRCKVGLYFTDEPPERVPVILRVGPRFLDLPPGEVEHVADDRYVLPVATELRSVYAHCHKLGRRVEGWAELPDGSKRWLLRIPRWDFDWQDEYEYREPVRLPAGTTLHARFVFDNSAGNPENPFHPPRRVLYGMRTSAEMADLWFQALPVRAADRDVLARHFLAQEIEKEISGDLRMLQVRPDDAELHRNLAANHAQLGRDADVVHHLERAVELDPEDAHSRYNLAGHRATAGRVEEAERLLRAALAIDPRHYASHVKLAALLRESGRPEEALAHYREAISARPGSAEAFNDLGTTLGGMGREDEALWAFRRAVELDPGLFTAHVNLGVALESRGRSDEAAAAYRRALELQPGNPIAEQRLQALGRL